MNLFESKLSHLLNEEDADHSMGVRAFSHIDSPSQPEENWGMEDLEEIYPTWLTNVHNKFMGKRCFLFGSGPSLLGQVDLLAKMTSEYTFTCNRINKWKEIPFRPYIHCVTEPGPLLGYGRKVGAVYDYPTATNKVAIAWWPVTAKGWLWCPKAPDDIQCRWNGYWGWQDYLPPLPTAWASPLTMGQLALWMGFRELYVLGSELTQDGQAWDKEHGRTAAPRQIRSILESADRARRDVKRAGGSLIDCTPGGRMNIEGTLPYMELEEVLGST